MSSLWAQPYPQPMTALLSWCPKISGIFGNIVPFFSPVTSNIRNIIPPVSQESV